MKQQNQAKLFVLKSCADLFRKHGFTSPMESKTDEDRVELKKENIRWLVREFQYRGYQEESGNSLMIQIAIRDPSLTGTEHPLEWPSPLGSYLGVNGITTDTNAPRLVIGESNVFLAREQVETVVLPWITTVTNMNWLRMLYEKRVEELNPQPAFFGLLTKRVKERPIDHFFLSLLRWHCGNKQGAMEQAKRYLALLPDDKSSSRLYNWLKEATKD